MKTITAKELRTNLDSVVARARSGEHIRVTYRSKPAFTIVPEPSSANSVVPGSSEAIQQFLKRVEEHQKPNNKLSLDPNTPVKELYHQMLDTNPKYLRYHNNK